MNKPPSWFTAIAGIALVWNLAGLFAVLADLTLSAADIAALPLAEQALHKARPIWSAAASVIAVIGGTLGCVGLLLRKRFAVVALYISLTALAIQDIGLFVFASAVAALGIWPLVFQSVVFLIALALLLLGRRALARAWLV